MTTQEVAEKFYREILDKIDKLLPIPVQEQVERYVGTKYKKQVGSMLLIARFLTLSYSEVMELAQKEKDDARYWELMLTANSILKEVGKHAGESWDDKDNPNYIG